jgi:ABC-type phosphate/phosphonate transport system substrate-binding protein
MSRVRVGRILLSSLLLGGTAFAGPRDFVVEHAGAGGTSQQAAPYIAKFLRHAETALGWPANSLNGEFFAEPNDAAKYIGEKKPGFGMVDPDVLLALKKRENLQVLASADSKNNLGKLHLVVKSPAYKSIDDLKGKTVISNHLQSPKYLMKVVFDGKIGEPDKYFGKMVEAPGMLKGVKAVDRGEADAVLLSDAEVASISKTTYPDLKVIWSSAELPPMAVVAFGKNAQPKDVEAFKKMLLGMCSDPKGAEVCKDLDITKFTPPADAAYQAAQKKFDK